MAEKQMRLDKFIAETAELTRKDAKTVLSKGRVTINGTVVKDGDKKVTGTEEICLDGKVLGIR